MTANRSIKSDKYGDAIEVGEQQQLLAYSRAITEALPDEMNVVANYSTTLLGYDIF